NREIILKEIKDNFVIAVDTREQKELRFDCKTVKLKNDIGDYTALSEYHSNVFIDRKNPNDFISTLSGGFERFEREVERAENLHSYLVVLCEWPLSKML